MITNCLIDGKKERIKKLNGNSKLNIGRLPDSCPKHNMSTIHNDATLQRKLFPRGVTKEQAKASDHESDLKSVNLQYNTLGCCFVWTNEPATAPSI